MIGTILMLIAALMSLTALLGAVDTDAGVYFGDASDLEYDTVQADGLEATLKDFGQALRSLLDHNIEIYKKFEKTTESRAWRGKRYLVPLEIARTGAFGAVKEYGDMPKPGMTDYKEGIEYPKWIYGTIGWTGEAMTMAQGAGLVEGAKPVMEREMSNFMKGFTEWLQNQLWGTGTGTIGVIKAYTGTSATGGIVELYARSQAENGWGDTNTAAAGASGIIGLGEAKYVRPGMRLCWATKGQFDNYLSAGTTTGMDGAEVIKQTGLQTFTMAAHYLGTGDLPVQYDLVCVGHNDGTSWYGVSYGLEFNGLLGMAADFHTDEGDAVDAEGWTLHSLNRFTHTGLWSPTTVDGAWREPSKRLLEQLFEAGDQQGGIQIDLVMMHTSMREYFVDDIASDRRYTGLNVDMGWKGITFTAGLDNQGKERVIEILFHKSVPHYAMFGMQKEYFYYSMARKGSWLTWNNGGKIVRPVGRKNAGESFFGQAGNFMCKKRQGLVVMKDVYHEPQWYGAG